MGRNDIVGLLCCPGILSPPSVNFHPLPIASQTDLPHFVTWESYKELKEDYLAFVITMVDILNGAAYLFEKKPDSDNRHWKEQQEIQQYCEALGKEIGGKEKQGRKGY